MIKTGTKIIGAIITLAMAAVAYQMIFRSPAARRTAPDEEVMVLTVLFDPPIRDGNARVVIQVMVGGVNIGPPVNTGKSPWDRVVQVRKGKNLVLRAGQAYGLRLDCKIQHREIVVVNHVEGPGFAQCERTAGART